MVPTPFKDSVFRIQPKSFGSPVQFPLMGEDYEGTDFLMDREVLEQHGLTLSTDDFRIRGHFSPRHQITLRRESQRQVMRIPPEARTFVFSYPVEGWSAVGSEGGAGSGGWLLSESGCQSGPGHASACSSFLSVGGFVYIDKDYAILGCTTLMAAGGDTLDGELVFGDPKPWSAEWTRILQKQQRIRQVTIQALLDAGARYFCWLRPGEHFPELKIQLRVPHGGFVYLFGEDLAAHPMDRYFAAHVEGEVDEPEVLVTCHCLKKDAVPVVPFQVTTLDERVPAQVDLDNSDATMRRAVNGTINS